MKHNSTSTYLIFLASFLLCINLIMLFFVFQTVRMLESDASTINEMGIIRGSIQRITKIKISGEKELYSNTIEDTDNLIKKLISDKDTNLFSRGEYKFDIKNIIKIESEWQDLKQLLSDYTKNPSHNLLVNILDKSEQCWELADIAVSNAQTVAENKVSGIKFFYVILFVYTINVFVVIWVAYSFVRKNLEFRASYDSLTGLLNRHSYRKTIKVKLEKSIRCKTQCSLIIYDVDFFKKINDTYGHETGDKVLIAISKLVKNTIRKDDTVFRIGGEEFTIILPETTVDDAFLVAEKVRKAIEENPVYNNIKVTISSGVADSNSDTTPSSIYQQADKALYKAKNSGRNKVEKYINEQSNN